LLTRLFAAGGTALWIYIVRKAWGFQAALMFAVWWLMPPPFVAEMLHQAFGNHMESIFWSGLLIALFVNENHVPPRRVRLGLAAFIAGFASFFCPQNLAISAALFTAAMLRWRRTAPLRILVVSAPFFMLGVFPYLIYRIKTGEYSHFVTTNPQPWQRWYDLVTRCWFAAPGYSARAVSAAVGALFILGVAAAVWRFWGAERQPTADRTRRLWLGRLLLFQLGYYWFAYAFSQLHISGAGGGVRYLITIYPSLMALVCFMLSRLPRLAGWLAIAPFLVAGLYNAHPASTVIAAERQWREGTLGSHLLAMRGDDYRDIIEHGLMISLSFSKPSKDQRSFRQAAADVDKLPSNWQALGYETLGFWLGDENTLAAILNGNGFPSIHKKDLAIGAGIASKERAQGVYESYDEVPAKMLRRIAVWRERDPELALYFVRGLGQNWLRWFLDAVPGPSNELYPVFTGHQPIDQNFEFKDKILQRIHRLSRDFVRALSPEEKVAFVGGIGRFINWTCDFETMCRFPAFLGFDGTPEEVAAFRQAYTDQFALEAMARNNRLRLPLPVKDENRVRQYLLDHGMTLTIFSLPGGPSYLQLAPPSR
jgi:hypothetical protein